MKGIKSQAILDMSFFLNPEYIINRQLSYYGSLSYQ